MQSMETYTEMVDTTFFKKGAKLSIENAKIGELVCITVENPLRYGVRELCYFGRIVKVTKCYFWIVEYLGPNLGFSPSPVHECRTGQVEHHDLNQDKYTKKWAKKSLIDAWEATMESRVVEKQFWRTIKETSTSS